MLNTTFMEMCSRTSVAIYRCVHKRQKVADIEIQLSLIALAMLDRLDEGSSRAGLSSRLW